MTRVLLSFDTEDYINPIAVEGIVRSSRLLRKYGIRGCYNVVAKLAEALVKWERQDAIEELRHHEIETHSYKHSMHPTINEYTDIEDFENAKSLFLEEEVKAVAIIKEIIGTDEVVAACPPGSSVSYVAHYGYADMGIKTYDGDLLIDAKRSRPIFYGNVAALNYDKMLDKFLIESSREDIDALLEKIADKKDVFIFYHHPQKAYVSQHPDIVNCIMPDNESEWKLSERLPEESTEKFYENFEYLIQKLLADNRFKFTTYKEIEEEYCNGKRYITMKEIPEIKRQLEEYFFPVTTPDSYCITDVLFAARDLLLGKEKHECGYVYGFLNTPYGITEKVTLTKDDVIASAYQIKDYFLPEKIYVRDFAIGPRDWLFAALKVLTGEESFEILPGDFQIDMDQFPKMRDLNLRKMWIDLEGFEDKYLSERGRLQSWTYRLPKNTDRKIF